MDKDRSQSLRRSQVIHYVPRLALSSGLLHHQGMPDSGEAFPLTNDEVRRRRLAVLLNSTDGGLEEIASKAKCSSQNLDHILKRRKQKKRADGSQPLVMMGDKLARDIEKGMGLPQGWLDWPFMHVPYEAYSILGPAGRAVIEGQMIAALQQAMKLPNVVQRADRKTSVSNKAVEDAYGVLPEAEIKAAHARAHRKHGAVVDPKDPKLRQRSLLDK